MTAMRTEVLGWFAIPWADLGKAVTQFADDLRALFPVVIVKVLAGCRTSVTTHLFRHTIARIAHQDRCYFFARFFFRPASSCFQFRLGRGGDDGGVVRGGVGSGRNCRQLGCFSRKSSFGFTSGFRLAKMLLSSKIIRSICDLVKCRQIQRTNRLTRAISDIRLRSCFR